MDSRNWVVSQNNRTVDPNIDPKSFARKGRTLLQGFCFFVFRCSTRSNLEFGALIVWPGCWLDSKKCSPLQLSLHKEVSSNGGVSQALRWVWSFFDIALRYDEDCWHIHTCPVSVFPSILPARACPECTFGHVGKPFATPRHELVLLVGRQKHLRTDQLRSSAVASCYSRRSSCN